jgi:hypothetical protein
MMSQANGWKEVQKKSWEMRERPDWRKVEPNYRLNANRARAKIVALGVLETLLNAVINKAIREGLTSERRRGW